MKTLLLIRHAKSSWSDASQQDFDRTLNERGHKDAPEMAKRLLKKNITVDAFISSPAKRALTTCKYFAEAYKRKEKEIIFKPELYLAPVTAFYHVIGNIDDSLHNIAVFAHNPGISEFANELTNVNIDNMPTCSIFAVSVNTESWQNFLKSEKKFMFFDYPKSKNS